ncbi:hypothetical protein Lfu02_04670 [Longispora fulva]|uniref:Transcriptional regulator with XRE-family HTH domain n=1 Tax=Longispora fulva TaxID=619741 RepID=A0A8J7GCT3_9ACTN|nr:helix-turn-helix transcriptional regulator [Longispora fulva]MBG6135665.1 transcriptional regulator with XRE-family HTH domain [Longispora fulva]GIG56095.1 hypothetical protein Lfu02_04670 [Longispora fulva]
MAPTRAPGRDSRHLARVLRTGSFAEALDAAITARGLTLDRLCHHLADRGVHVSRTTLSYWRRNRSRPERQASLRAVRALEDLLGLPSSSLVALLGPPRPRGRWLNELPDSCDRAYLWPSAAPGMAQLDAEPEGRFEALSIHDLVTVAPDRSELRMRSRAVLRALRGPVDRCLAFYQAEDPAHAVPALVDLRFCARGRQRYDPDSKLFVAELLLDRTVAAGEDTVIEYELGFGPGVPMDYFHHRFHRRVREYVLQVQFTGEVPGACHSYRKFAVDAPERGSRPVPIGASDTALLVESDVEPGVCGLRWRW